MNPWPKRIDDLIAAGWPLPRIAEELGAPYSTLADIRGGKTTDPRHALGAALIALHERECRADPTPTTQEAA